MPCRDNVYCHCGLSQLAWSIQGNLLVYNGENHCTHPKVTVPSPFPLGRVLAARKALCITSCPGWGWAVMDQGLHQERNLVMVSPSQHRTEGR